MATAVLSRTSAAGDRLPQAARAQPRRALGKLSAPSSTTAQADAVAVGTARMRCAHPITLVLRSDPAAGEARWARGPPARPVIHLGESVHADFDAAAEALTALAPGNVRRRTSPRRAPAARNLLDARVSLSKSDGGDPVHATVPLATLLESIVDQGRASADDLCVARSAPWVSHALARRPPPLARPARSAERARSDMERMMRRLDRIVSRVASEAAHERAGHASDGDDGHDDHGNDHGNGDDDDDHHQNAHDDNLNGGDIDATMDEGEEGDDDVEIVVRNAAPPVPRNGSSQRAPATGRQSPPPLPRPDVANIPRPSATDDASSEERAARRRAVKRPRPEPASVPSSSTATSTTTMQPRPAKRTRRTRAQDPPMMSSLPPRPSPMAISSPVQQHHHQQPIGTVLALATVVCDIALRPCAEAPGIECSICMRDDGTVLWDTPRGRPATLYDLWIDPDRRTVVADGMRLPDDVIVVNPCRTPDHAVCVGCMRAVLLNRGRPPVGVARAAVGCVSLDGESRCASTAYPEAHPFAVVLDGDEAAHLTSLYDRHRFPGMEVVVCPLHVVVDRPVPAGRRRGPRVEVLPCGAECIVEHTRVAAAARGHLPVACTQNARCAGTFCYHCRSRLPAGAARCGRCTHVAEQDNPEGVNRYFYRPGLMAPAGLTGKAGGGATDQPRQQQQQQTAGGGTDGHLLRNREVTEEVAIDQIERMLAMDRVAQPCYRCGVPLLKSTECNALSHCGVQKCYMCGRNALAGGHLEPEHWDAHGATGCPRYDHHAYWRSMKNPFVCAEGRCYSDAKECAVAAHRAGIEAMHAERRVWHAWGMLRSLAAPLCERVLSKLDAATAPTDTARALLLARVSKILLGTRAAASTSRVVASTALLPTRSSTTTTTTTSATTTTTTVATAASRARP
nr:hypothetical protein [Pandoravirus belohorizontensis]